MDRRSLVVRGSLGLLAAFAVLYLFSPEGLARQIWYDGLGLVSVVFAWFGIRYHRPTHVHAWHLVLLGYFGWCFGDLLSSLEQNVWHLSYYPVPSDAIYLGSYALIGTGLLRMARSRRRKESLGVLLDAAIIASGAAVLAGVFVLAPIVEDSSLTLAGKLVSAAYPLADVLMLALLIRLWATPGTRSSAFWLLNVSLASTLVGDVLWNFSVIATGLGTSAVWNDVFWLIASVGIAATCWSPTIQLVSEPLPARDQPGISQTRVVGLAAGLLLPAITLLLDGFSGGEVQWVIVGLGSLVLSVLVVARMANLIGLVQVQAVQLAALARSDSLTGAPNRRTWDFELSRACQRAREMGTPLVVALLDLDHFKRFNDTFGHQAGDRLLREAVAAWSDQLSDGEVLARYGGEEFALLLPGQTLEQARHHVDKLRRTTPGGQTFSAGVAMWNPATEPSDAVAGADRAMYDAKRTGRNRVCTPDMTGVADHLPDPTIVLQPIVDLQTGQPVAMEALSRFPDDNPVTVFARAHRAGDGPRLEAKAITAALKVRPRDLELTVNVSLESLNTEEIMAVLPDDLRGIVLEITEHSDVELDPALHARLDALRARGARIAVDDWGRGYANLDRLLRLRPEVVKLDMSLVHGLESDYHRATIRSVVAWADEVGVRVCAEGVETPEQLASLLALGVHTAQGYLFGRPATPEAIRAQFALVGDLTV
jgi:diguanylate cyclase (GGDEF)-like protein